MIDKELVKTRQELGIYSIEELADIFNISRRCIDNAINIKQLNFISPNNKQKFVYLNDFIVYMQKKGNCPNVEELAITKAKSK